jgi:acetylornithine deacetylase/succinyl-diaminopimelate desuccinylase-like protein
MQGQLVQFPIFAEARIGQHWHTKEPTGPSSERAGNRLGGRGMQDDKERVGQRTGLAKRCAEDLGLKVIPVLVFDEACDARGAANIERKL